MLDIATDEKCVIVVMHNFLSDCCDDDSTRVQILDLIFLSIDFFSSFFFSHMFPVIYLNQRT